VIDTIGFGYATVAARPFVIVPLLALELLLLILPQLRLQPLTDSVSDAVSGGNLDWQDVARDVEAFGDYNALEFAVLRVPLLRMPALMPVISDEDIDALPWTTHFDHLPQWFVLGVAAAALGAGFLIGAFYQLVAAAATGVRSVTDSVRPRELSRMALDLGAWFAIVFGMLILISLPMVAVTVGGVAFGFPEIAVLWLLLALPFTWGYIHFYFSIPALALDRGGAAQCLRSSYRVVRGGFWKSVQFIAVSLLISTGLTYALQSIATSGPGIMLALLVNAVVATGLLIAAMLFYRDRAARLSPTGTPPGR
jgi:hypothetical protein